MDDLIEGLDFGPDDDDEPSVQDTYQRLTGKSFDALPSNVKARMWTLPPDADQSDIDFAYDLGARDEQAGLNQMPGESDTEFFFRVQDYRHRKTA